MTFSLISHSNILLFNLDLSDFPCCLPWQLFLWTEPLGSDLNPPIATSSLDIIQLWRFFFPLS